MKPYNWEVFSLYCDWQQTPVTIVTPCSIPGIILSLKSTSTDPILTLDPHNLVRPLRTMNESRKTHLPLEGTTNSCPWCHIYSIVVIFKLCSKYLISMTSFKGIGSELAKTHLLKVQDHSMWVSYDSAIVLVQWSAFEACNGITLFGSVITLCLHLKPAVVLFCEALKSWLVHTETSRQ